ncbi:MAG: hypothetical protein HQL65_09345 [Magnetococcales bacterium]|nr:hypothetical protein [Magnetococcales bacterium]
MPKNIRPPDSSTNTGNLDFILLGVGILLVLGTVIITFVKPNPTPYQQTVFRTLIALGAAAFAAALPGFLNVDMRFKSSFVRASGALGVFVLVYFFTPAISPSATWPQHPETEDGVRVDLKSAETKTSTPFSTAADIVRVNQKSVDNGSRSINYEKDTLKSIDSNDSGGDNIILAESNQQQTSSGGENIILEKPAQQTVSQTCIDFNKYELKKNDCIINGWDTKIDANGPVPNGNCEAKINELKEAISNGNEDRIKRAIIVMKCARCPCN